MDDLTPEPRSPVDVSWVTTEPSHRWSWKVAVGVAFAALAVAIAFMGFGYVFATAAGWCS